MHPLLCFQIVFFVSCVGHVNFCTDFIELHSTRICIAAAHGAIPKRMNFFLRRMHGTQSRLGSFEYCWHRPNPLDPIQMNNFRARIHIHSPNCRIRIGTEPFRIHESDEGRAKSRFHRYITDKSILLLQSHTIYRNVALVDAKYSKQHGHNKALRKNSSTVTAVPLRVEQSSNEFRSIKTREKLTNEVRIKNVTLAESNIAIFLSGVSVLIEPKRFSFEIVIEQIRIWRFLILKIINWPSNNASTNWCQITTNCNRHTVLHAY